MQSISELNYLEPRKMFMEVPCERCNSSKFFINCVTCKAICVACIECRSGISCDRCRNKLEENYVEESPVIEEIKLCITCGKEVDRISTNKCDTCINNELDLLMAKNKHLYPRKITIDEICKKCLLYKILISCKKCRNGFVSCLNCKNDLCSRCVPNKPNLCISCNKWKNIDDDNDENIMCKKCNNEFVENSKDKIKNMDIKSQFDFCNTCYYPLFQIRCQKCKSKTDSCINCYKDNRCGSCLYNLDSKKRKYEKSKSCITCGRENECYLRNKCNECIDRDLNVIIANSKNLEVFKMKSGKKICGDCYFDRVSIWCEKCNANYCTCLMCRKNFDCKKCIEIEIAKQIYNEKMN